MGDKKGKEVDRHLGMTSEEHLITMVEDAEDDVEEDTEYKWTPAGVEFLTNNNLHRQMRAPDPGDWATKRQFKKLEDQIEGDDILDQALRAGFVESPAALDEIRKVPRETIKQELVDIYKGQL